MSAPWKASGAATTRPCSASTDVALGNSPRSPRPRRRRARADNRVARSRPDAAAGHPGRGGSGNTGVQRASRGGGLWRQRHGTVPSADGYSSIAGTSGTPYTGTGAATGDRSNVLASLQAQPYGATAIATADKLGVNSTGVAAFAAAESDFRNVQTANGSTSATGPWQITSGTWDDTVKRFSLPYTSADRSDPNAQAVVSSYLIRSYGGATSQSLGRVATVQETYYSYVYGPAVGGKIAMADTSSPLSNFVPADNLANNGMTGWTVGNLQDFTSRRLGPSATSSIFAARS